MKVLTEHHPVEKVLRQIEDILIESDLSIYYEHGIVIEDKDGTQYRLKNVAGMSSGDSLPRMNEEDKLTIEE